MSGEPAPESDAQLLASLRQMAREGRVELRIDPRSLDHIDSPVASEADGNRWAYAALALAVLLWWWQGWIAGVATLAAGAAVYFTLGRAYIHRRIERRVHDQALESVETWRKLWRFRGLTLAATGRPAVGECASPDGNWMAFVRALR